ncbi:MAG: family peptidase [Labilithrix sp.]|nr:family peptidase [Labilithrix sp.]
MNVNVMARRSVSGVVGLVALLGLVTEAHAATCYRLPFSNPDLADGWGSTKGRAHPHRGVDFPQPSGKAIPSVAAGTVAVITKTSCLGNVVVVKHADGMYSGYAHMREKSSKKVGEKISRGETLGHIGTTGTCTTGNHLHLTLGPAKTSVSYGKTVDPYKYIQSHKCKSGIAADDESQDDAAPELDVEITPDLTNVEALDSAEVNDQVEPDDDGPLPDEALESASCRAAPGRTVGGELAIGLVVGALVIAARRRRR